MSERNSASPMARAISLNAKNGTSAIHKSPVLFSANFSGRVQLSYDPPKGSFSIGGAKETAYAVFGALTDANSTGYQRVRVAHVEKAA